MKDIAQLERPFSSEQCFFHSGLDENRGLSCLMDEGMYACVASGADRADTAIHMHLLLNTSGQCSLYERSIRLWLHAWNDRIRTKSQLQISA